MNLININFLKNNGWYIVNDTSLEPKEIANFLIKEFNLTPNIEFSTIRPQSKSELLHGKNPTFSSIYGYDSFPLHTDKAFKKIPSRFLIMKSNHPSNTATVFFDFEFLFNNLCSASKNHFFNAIFAIKSTEGSYYNSLFINKTKKNIRFDPLIMTPQNSSATQCLNILKKIDFSDSLVHKIFWTGSNTLIIDNWRILHGRQKVTKLEYNSRKLQRIYVG